MKLVRLARFANDSPQVETFEADIEETAYIAVSHVWSNARWQRVDGFADEVLVSDHKAEFLIQQLPSLVGDVPFWMDVVCVDQRDKLARKAVVGSIPDVFRLAVRTIAVRDGDGLRQCCIDAIGTFKSWTEEALPKLGKHAQDHFQDPLLETYLDRLWTLQEILFSDVVQFVSCPTHPSVVTNRPKDFNLWKIDFDRIEDGIYTLGHTWYRYGGGSETDDERAMSEFAYTFLTSGTVSRVSRAVPLEDIGPPDNLFYAFFLNSSRVATVPSDYVLSTFPQFNWYILPPGFKLMSFSDLFMDAYHQARASGHGFIPRITRSMTLGCDCDDPWKPSTDIPVPSTLGDFLKLMGNTAWHSPLTEAAFTSQVLVRDAVSMTNMASALDIISKSIDHAWYTWSEAHRGELALFGSWPEDDPTASGLCFGFDEDGDRADLSGLPRNLDFFAWHVEQAWERLDPGWVEQECRRILDLLYSSRVSLRNGGDGDMMTREWEVYKRWLLKRNPPFYREGLLMLAAMVNCRVPLSAYELVKQRFEAVMVSFHMTPPLLGLLAKQKLINIHSQSTDITSTRAVPAWKSMKVFTRYFPSSFSAFCAERISKRRWPTGQDLVLVDMQTRSPIGLLPDFMRFYEPDEVVTNRLTQLYHGAWKSRHDQVHLPFNRIEHVRLDKEVGRFYDPELESMSADQIQKLLYWKNLTFSKGHSEEDQSNDNMD